ncbi:cyclin-dependent kinase 2 [Caerostris extrusa]|uniref:Cyclin-dependent kinase 2 n=1 Tax=Caerostris extrusa TaxID=172846 RepID=A0AAV4VIG9_CAEEX|nr:cyclin-dependent kinase 2 [Caerostris extrusa]
MENIIPGLDYQHNEEDSDNDIFENYISPSEMIGNCRSKREFVLKKETKLKAASKMHKVMDNKNKKEVTMIWHERICKREEEFKDLIKEGEHVRKLKHPCIFQFYEIIIGHEIYETAFIYESHCCVLSKLLKLEKKESKVFFTNDVIKHVMQNLFSALDYLHKKSIIHRDIQPENLIFTSSGVLKVWNFKNAQNMEQRMRELKSNEFRYHPIELILKDKTYNTSVDIWSAACVFAHMLLKKPIFPDFGREIVLQDIFRILGFPKKDYWKEFYSYPELTYLLDFKVHEYNCLDLHLKKYSTKIITSNCLDLLHLCFLYNPEHRNTAEECLMHPYF